MLYMIQASASPSQELTLEQLALPGVKKMLSSFRVVRCAYTHSQNPSHHYLHALRVLFFVLAHRCA